VLDEVEQVAVSPVQVFEDQHQWALGGERLEKVSPGEEGFGPAVLPGAIAARKADERTKVLLYPVGLLIVAKHLADRRAQFLGSVCGGIGLEDPCLRLEDLAQCPERHPCAIRNAATLTPGDSGRSLPELMQQPRLADAGRCSQRHEPC
jgi:hypothetical protein